MAECDRRSFLGAKGAAAAVLAVLRLDQGALN
jgi:hypothetical protein